MNEQRAERIRRAVAQAVAIQSAVTDAGAVHERCAVGVIVIERFGDGPQEATAGLCVRTHSLGGPNTEQVIAALRAAVALLERQHRSRGLAN